MKYLLPCFVIGAAWTQTIPSGPLAQAPTVASNGATYLSTDPTVCSGLYVWVNGGWQQLFSLGTSGALSCGANGTLDINTSTVPTLWGADEFHGAVTFDGPVVFRGGVSGGPALGTTAAVPVAPITPTTQASPALQIVVNGIPQPARAKLNITGLGVSVADNGTDTLTISLPAPTPTTSAPTGSYSAIGQNALGQVTISENNADAPLFVQGGNANGLTLALRPSALNAHAINYFSNPASWGLWDQTATRTVYEDYGGAFVLHDPIRLQPTIAQPACSAVTRHMFWDQEVPGQRDHFVVCQMQLDGSFRWMNLN